MPKRNDLNTILIIGSGPIVIGQACEFDYAGTQACLVLKELGYRVVLINSNPATIMTDPKTAHRVYIEPITWQMVEKIIQIEKPDALLTTMGGQTAINCTMDLIHHGVLEKYSVALIGADRAVLAKAEDRALFQQAMHKIGLKTPKSEIATTLEEACAIVKKIGFPAMIRSSFTLGGVGSGIALNQTDFIEKCQAGFVASPTHSILIEESIIGWKEYELELVRDKNDNCIVVCSIENIDPMGVHTGDSITVAPAQTLTDREYQAMRTAAIAVLREVGVETGGANVQFAVHPHTGALRVIEMNPRVSRSSALASKATGFPIARVAAQLAVGFTLDELQNTITAGYLPASFEPTLDYVVVKIPRFHFEKFKGARNVLTTQMHSVGEVMAMGSCFLAALQKALCGLEINVSGLAAKALPGKEEIDWKSLLSSPTPERIFFVGDAFRAGCSFDLIAEYTQIEPWFLVQIQTLICLEKEIKEKPLEAVTKFEMRAYKQQGFSDRYLAYLWQVSPDQIREKRKAFGIVPAYKRVDSCSAEFPSKTAYLYSTYEMACEANPASEQKIMILGSGPNRIGQGIEFDYSCVHAAQAVRALGFKAIMVNCNPETVSTDHSVSDKLYFEPLTLEHVLDLVDIEKPQGVLIQFGGQTPLKLAKDLVKHNVPILGTSVENIHLAEDRACFQKIISDLGLLQPESQAVHTVDAGLEALEQLGLPLIVRPSYVLGGQGMEVIFDRLRFVAYLEKALSVNNQHPVLVEKFLENAIEVDVDAVSDGTDTWIAGILEHVEKAGIHSGDSICAIPPFSLSAEIQIQMDRQAKKIAKALGVVGLMNIQFAIQGKRIFILEVNSRASRTVPFIAKAIGKPVAEIATRCILGKSLKAQACLDRIEPKQVCVKFPVFVFDKFQGTSKLLGPEMKSTGEVMGQGATFEKAYAKFAVATRT